MHNLDIVIVDYGVGNIASVEQALKRLGVSYVVSDKLEDIGKAKRIILPGVGAFCEAMKNLESRGLIKPLRAEVAENKKPLLGICLGMQVLGESSTEGGEYKGLGFIPGRVIKIEGKVRVPHVGWSELQIVQKDPLFSRVPQGSHFYFDHSYHMEVSPECVAATCEYGGAVVAAIKSGNIMGVQFHPEKSHLAGLRLIKGFLNP